MAAGMILAGLSDREHGSGSKRSFPKNKGANTNCMARPAAIIRRRTLLRGGGLVYSGVIA
jgi:hypothetical protein